jgi:phage terminase large subunit-like protein
MNIIDFYHDHKTIIGIDLASKKDLTSIPVISKGKIIGRKIKT